MRSDVQTSIKKTRQAKDLFSLELGGSSPSEIFANIDAFENPDAWKAFCNVLEELTAKDLAYFDRQIRAPQFSKLLKCDATLTTRLDKYWKLNQALLVQHLVRKNYASAKLNRDPAGETANPPMQSIEVTIRPGEHPRITGSPAEGVVYEKQIAFVFDDGGVNLSPERTDQLLDILKTARVHATFFQTGQSVRENPYLTRKIAAKGHTVASHSMTHTALSRIGLMEAFKDIDKGQEEVTACTGQEVPFIRLPFDASNDELNQYLRQKKITVFYENISAHDWQITDTSELYDQIIKSVEREKGGILLLHENNAASLIVLPYLLEELRTRGFSSVVFTPGST